MAKQFSIPQKNKELVEKIEKAWKENTLLIVNGNIFNFSEVKDDKFHDREKVKDYVCYALQYKERCDIDVASVGCKGDFFRYPVCQMFSKILKAAGYKCRRIREYPGEGSVTWDLFDTGSNDYNRWKETDGRYLKLQSMMEGIQKDTYARIMEVFNIFSLSYGWYLPYGITKFEIVRFDGITKNGYEHIYTVWTEKDGEQELKDMGFLEGATGTVLYKVDTETKTAVPFNMVSIHIHYEKEVA